MANVLESWHSGCLSISVPCRKNNILGVEKWKLYQCSASENHDELRFCLVASEIVGLCSCEELSMLS